MVAANPEPLVGLQPPPPKSVGRRGPGVPTPEAGPGGPVRGGTTARGEIHGTIDRAWSQPAAVNGSRWGVGESWPGACI